MKDFITLRNLLRQFAVFTLGGMILGSLCGCVAPRRTFVAEPDRRQRANTPQELKSSVGVPPTPKPPETQSSMWSKLVGSLSPGSGQQTPPKPAERIPLPRTDGQTESEISGEQSLEDLPF